MVSVRFFDLHGLIFPVVPGAYFTLNDFAFPVVATGGPLKCPAATMFGAGAVAGAVLPSGLKLPRS